MAENNHKQPEESNFDVTVKKIYNLLGLFETEYNENVNLELQNEILNLIEIFENTLKSSSLAEGPKHSPDLISTLVLENYTRQLNKSQQSKLLQIINKLKRLDDINRIIIAKNQRSEEHISKLCSVKNYIQILESLCISKDSAQMLVQSKRLINCFFSQEAESTFRNSQFGSRSSFRSSCQSLASTLTLQSESKSAPDVEEKPQKNEIGEAEVHKLLRESVLQHKIMMQVSRAIQVCVKHKKLKYTTVHIEAERILLWTCQKRKAISNELNKYDSNYMKQQSGNCRFAEIVIKNVILNLKHVLDDLEKSLVEWFLVLVNYEETVLASKVVKVHNDGVLRIEDEIKLTNLQESLDVTLNIYHLAIIEGNEVASKTLLYKIKEFFKKSRISTSNYYPSRNPSFALRGICTFRIDDLHKMSLVQQSSAPDAPSNGAFTIKLSSELPLTGTCSGFLKPYVEKESVLVTSL